MKPPRSPPRLRVGIVGLGYMGLATGLAFSAHGHQVIGYDIKPEIRQSVAAGSAPYREVGLAPLLRREVRSGRFQVAESLRELAGRAQGIFLCVPTPSRSSGRIDLRPLMRSAQEVGASLRPIKEYRLVVVKSTVVPGTTEEVVAPIVRERSGKTAAEIGVAANPEFLAEGSLVQDALHPDRVVIGTNDPHARAWLRRAYLPFGAPIFSLSPSGAELVKYSANSFLALKVSFANEISRISDRLGVSVDEVMDAVGHDPRIGKRFLRAGPGFGGSCFDKDVRALVKRSSDLDLRFRAGETALRINDEQLAYSVDLVRSAVGPLAGKTLAVLGLAFKAGTDDVRETRALPLVRALVDAGAVVRAHDPVAIENFRRLWNEAHPAGEEGVQLAPTVEEALRGADAAVLQADWPLYLKWTPAWTGLMRRPLLIDLRRAIGPAKARSVGITLVALGAGSASLLSRAESSTERA